jgi:hypothetical protein
MSQVIIQVCLNMPDGSGKELSGETYEELIDDKLEEMIQRGELPGISHATATFEEVV